MIERTTLRADDGRTWEVPSNRLNPWHTIWLSARDYRIAHPIDCDLLNCEADNAAASYLHTGIYKWTEQDGMMYDLYANSGARTDGEEE